MYVGMYVCMYVCMYMCTYICTCIHASFPRYERELESPDQPPHTTNVQLKLSCRVQPGNLVSGIVASNCCTVET